MHLRRDSKIYELLKDSKFQNLSKIGILKFVFVLLCLIVTLFYNICLISIYIISMKQIFIHSLCGSLTTNENNFHQNKYKTKRQFHCCWIVFFLFNVQFMCRFAIQKPTTGNAHD